MPCGGEAVALPISPFSAQGRLASEGPQGLPSPHSHGVLIVFRKLPNNRVHLLILQQRNLRLREKSGLAQEFQWAHGQAGLFQFLAWWRGEADRGAVLSVIPYCLLGSCLQPCRELGL